jgi:hypothetical protein
VSIDRYFVRAARVLHPAQVASYGDATFPDYASGTSESVMGWLEQISGSEVESPTRDAQVSTHRFFCADGSDIFSTDRLVVDGLTFDVDGPSAAVWTPRGGHHLEVSLRYVEG